MDRIDIQEASDIMEANVNKMVEIKTRTGIVLVMVLEALDEKEIAPFWKVDVIEWEWDIENLTIDEKKLLLSFWIR